MSHGGAVEAADAKIPWELAFPSRPMRATLS